jgi:hypothetical protein
MILRMDTLFLNKVKCLKLCVVSHKVSHIINMLSLHYNVFSKMVCVVNQKQIWNDVMLDNGDPVRKVKKK